MKSRRGFGRISPEEWSQAEVFFEDLMGGPARRARPSLRTRGWSPEALPDPSTDPFVSPPRRAWSPGAGPELVEEGCGCHGHAHDEAQDVHAHPEVSEEGCGCHGHDESHVHHEGCGCHGHDEHHVHHEGCGCHGHDEHHVHHEGCGCHDHDEHHVHHEGCGCHDHGDHHEATAPEHHEEGCGCGDHGEVIDTYAYEASDPYGGEAHDALHGESFDDEHAFEDTEAYDYDIEAYETETTQAPYLPEGGRNFVPQAATFNCHPPTPFTVIPASYLPQRTTDPNAAIDAALTTAGLDATQRGQINRTGLTPIATELGARALTELFARLRWSAADIVGWGNGVDEMLVQRLLLHVPGHFRELARRAPTEAEAFVLECMGWLLMATLRDQVNAASSRSWWLPPAPTFVTAVPNPIPAVSPEVRQLLTRYGYIDTLMTPEQWNGRFQAWFSGLPGRQWHAEINAAQPGRPFYASLVTVPAHVDTTAARTAFATAWSRKLADVDARFPPLPPGAAAVTLSGLQNAVELRRCDNTSPHLPAGAIGQLGLQGLELAYEFPMTQNRTKITRLALMAQLHPVYTAVFRAIRELGWNDLVFQTSGAGCFRGIKHPGAARVNVGGTMVIVDPFNAPNATTVTRINTNFSAAQRAKVVAACRSARTMSQHGIGAALDLDVPENAQDQSTRPYGSMDPRVVALFEAFHFRWGACFNPTDPHHFEYCQTPCAPAPTPASTPGTTPRGMIPRGAGSGGPVIV